MASQKNRAPEWTNNEKEKGKEISKRRRRARQMSSTEAFGSEEYWNHSIEETIADGELNDLNWEVGQRWPEETKEFQQAQEIYLQRRNAIEAKQESLRQKAQRFEKMRKFLSTTHTDSLENLRAAYLDLVCTLYSKTSRKDQPQFVESLRQHYGHTKAGRVDLVWDVIQGCFQARSNMRAAHIFPLMMGQKSMDYIFGEDAEDEINRARNGLFLPPVVEEAYDAHQVVIVPDEPQADPPEYKFLVVDKTGLWKAPALMDGKTTFEHLHERRLQFQPGNKFRPRARYLYFRYILAMLVLLRSRNTKHGIHKMLLPEFDMPQLSRVWATRGKYLRKNLIHAFIEGIGHELPPEDSENMLEHAAGEIATNEAEAARNSVEGLDLTQSDGEEED
jgi:hypothetical protein